MRTLARHQCQHLLARGQRQGTEMVRPAERLAQQRRPQRRLRIMHHVIRPQQHLQAAGSRCRTGPVRRRHDRHQRLAQRQLHPHDARPGRSHHHARHHRALADETGHIGTGRAVIEPMGRIPLLHAATADHADPVADGKGFLLVVRHQDRRRVRRLQDLPHLQPQLLAQAGIQARERLVQQQQGRLRRQRPCQRHPLLLTAGQLMRITAGLRLQMRQTQHLVHPCGPLLARAPLQAEADVLRHRQMRK